YAAQDRNSTIFQLAQIAETLLERPQLRVIEPSCRFFPVAGDERHGRAFVEQRDGGEHLLGLDGQFGGDARLNRGQHETSTGRNEGSRRSRELWRSGQARTSLASTRRLG